MTAAHNRACPMERTHQPQWRVLDRTTKTTYRRGRQTTHRLVCLHCGAIWTTHEEKHSGTPSIGPGEQTTAAAAMAARRY